MPLLSGGSFKPLLDQFQPSRQEDDRERKGAFYTYTPRIWGELSQKYIAEVLDEDFQLLGRRS